LVVLTQDTDSGGVRILVAIAAGGMAAALTAACDIDLARERTCSDGYVPAYQVRSPEVGGTCVTEDKKPSPRWATFPPGLVPEYFDQIITCPDDGQCHDGPLAIHCPKTFPREPCTIAGHELPLPPPRQRAGSGH
jgi:hypothetical protein